jgi:NAD(P)-dependent dehydrogenase (short-subunit alcohol dehydrogenase family)
LSVLELRDRKSLVVGGGQGIGRATALLLAEAGADVVVVDVDSDRAESVAEEVRKKGRRGIASVADVVDAEQAARAVRDAVESLGGLDLVANIVGQSSWGLLLSMDDETWDRDFAVNLKQQLYVARSAAQYWIDAGAGGALCVVASASGLFGAGQHGAYGAAKAGVLSFVKTAAEEWVSHGIRVNAVVPGAVRTPRIEASWADGRVPRPTDDLLDCMALPEDIAGAILYLLSDLAKKVTGQSIVVDGGWTTRFPYRLE